MQRALNEYFNFKLTVDSLYFVTPVPALNFVKIGNSFSIYPTPADFLACVNVPDTMLSGGVDPIGDEVTSKTLDRERVKYLCNDRVVQYYQFVSRNMHILSK